MRLLCSWMCRAHCHRLIKLSGTLGRFAPEKELVENVHGVRASFLDTGKEVRKRLEGYNGAKDPVFGAEADPTIYFIGKILWSKGLLSLMELLKYAEESAGIKVQVDMYGGGPDKEAAEDRAKSLDVELSFLGPIDHGELGTTHKIFINPSTSEVLTTTTAEALAMGKFVIVPSHPSNDFFAQFSNCLAYSNKEEFVGTCRWMAVIAYNSQDGKIQPHSSFLLPFLFRKFVLCLDTFARASFGCRGVHPQLGSSYEAP